MIWFHNLLIKLGRYRFFHPRYIVKHISRFSITSQFCFHSRMIASEPINTGMDPSTSVPINRQHLAETHVQSCHLMEIGKFVLQSTIELLFRNVICPDFWSRSRRQFVLWLTWAAIRKLLDMARNIPQFGTVNALYNSISIHFPSLQSAYIVQPRYKNEYAT